MIVYGGIKLLEVFDDVICFSINSKIFFLIGMYMFEKLFGFGCVKLVIYKKYLDKFVF